MPELPEVETVRAGLDVVLSGQKISSVSLGDKGLRKPFPHQLAQRLKGAEVLRLRRRAKYLLADLSTGETMLVHLGMSGRFQICGNNTGHFHHAPSLNPKHNHLILDMATGTRIIFNDPRRFGLVDICPTKQLESYPLLVNLGPEPLGNQFDAKHLFQRLHGRTMSIKAALLNQHIVAGLGNIYVCEALHQAGIDPQRQAGQISSAQIDSLVQEIRIVLRAAITAGGASLRDHRQTNGELGYFQHQFKAYGRINAPCTKPQCIGKITRIIQSGRSSFYCPTCQR